jgi:hypothetical protein
MKFFCNTCVIEINADEENLCIESNFIPNDHESPRVVLSADDPARLLVDKPCKCGMPYRTQTLTPSLIAYLVCSRCKLIEQNQ